MANEPQKFKQPVPEMPAQVNIERVTKYEVYDAADNHIGSTSAIWMDKSNQPAFLGIKTNWFMGKTHVIPALGAQVNHAAKRVRIPCDADVVRDAPMFAPDEELDYGKERQVLDYYQSKGAFQPAEAGRSLGTAEANRPTLAEANRLKAEEAGRLKTAEANRLKTEQANRPAAAEANRRVAEEANRLKPAVANRSTAEEATIPLHEETVKVGKRSVEAGGVRLRKIVRTETVQQQVELQREDIKIEHLPGTGKPASAQAFEDQDIYIALRREEPVVEKQTQVREEVRAQKTAGKTEHRDISSEVRKEDIQVDREEERKAA